MVILIGFMGSGKTHVGRELARLLSRPLVDLDARIGAAAGQSIPDIFAQLGEAAFRDLESRELKRALAEHGVLSTGGGIVTHAANRGLLRECNAPVVWLAASPQVLAARIRSEPGARPLIDGDGLLDMAATIERVQVLLQAREPFYRECATLVVETDGRAPNDIAGEIGRELGH